MAKLYSEESYNVWTNLDSFIDEHLHILFETVPEGVLNTFWLPLRADKEKFALALAGHIYKPSCSELTQSNKILIKIEKEEKK